MLFFEITIRNSFSKMLLEIILRIVFLFFVFLEMRVRMFFEITIRKSFSKFCFEINRDRHGKAGPGAALGSAKDALTQRVKAVRDAKLAKKQKLIDKLTNERNAFKTCAEAGGAGPQPMLAPTRRQQPRVASAQK